MPMEGVTAGLFGLLLKKLSGKLWRTMSLGFGITAKP
jgi:hypothetical protein